MAPPITCDCDECAKCKRRVYMRDYYARNAARARAIARASRNRRIEQAREYDRQRGHRSYGQEKEIARRRAYKALLAGRLLREPCEVCGDHAEMHHDDYARPLDVRWLCRTHHAEVHHRVRV